jgi:pilus assembly protein Flp/PilA
VGGRIRDAAIQWTSRGEKIMKSLLTRFRKNESGATAIEYGLIAGLMAVIVITAVATFGTGLQTTFANLSTKLGTTGAAVLTAGTAEE